jgi:hypothetical protein
LIATFEVPDDLAQFLAKWTLLKDEHEQCLRVGFSAMVPSVPEIITSGDEKDSKSSGLRIRCPRCGLKPWSDDR